MSRYSQEFKEQIVRKMMPPSSQSVAQISRETNISSPTLYAWRNQYRAQGYVVPATHKDPEGWDWKAKAAAALAWRLGFVHAATLARRDRFRRNTYDEFMKLFEDANLWIRSYLKYDLNAEILPMPSPHYYRVDTNVTYDKLRVAYRSHRQAILTSAAGCYLKDRISVYGVSVAKSMGAFLAHHLRSMHLIRVRRNITLQSVEKKAMFDGEIHVIRSTPLPLHTEYRVAYGN